MRQVSEPGIDKDNQEVFPGHAVHGVTNNVHWVRRN
jgi:hypothetical protein